MECQSPDGRYAEGSGSGMAAAPPAAAPAPAAWQKATSNYHYGTACNADIRHTTGTSSYPRAPMAANFSRDFSTFAVESNASALTYFINDTIVNVVAADAPGWAAPFSLPTWDMYLILSQAYMAHRPLGDPPSWAWPVEQVIDYVRVYTWSN